MRRVEITNTGIPLLDSLLSGGFLSNSIIVISYQTEFNFWAFVYRMIYKILKEKLHYIGVGFHLSLGEILDSFKSFMSSEKLLKEGIEIVETMGFNFIDCFNIPKVGEDLEKDGIHYVSNPFKVDKLLSVMSNVRENVPKDKQVIWSFYDLTNMSIGVPEGDLVKFCRRAFRYHKQRGDLAIYYLNEKAHSNMFFAKIYQLSDVFIKFISEEAPMGLISGVQVIEGVFPFESKKVFYDVDKNGEIQIITNKMDSKPRMPILSPPTERFESRKGEIASKIIKTGIPRIGSLLGGGMLSNSIIVASYQYGVRVLEPLTQIFQSQFGEKNQIIMINYHFSSQEIEPRLKMLERASDIHKGSAKSLSYGNVIFIDCFNILESETDTQRNNFYSISNPFDVDKLLSVMTKVRNSIPEDKSVLWVFISLTDMSVGVPEDELVKFCRRAFRYHKFCRDLAIYLLVEPAHSEMFRAKLYQLADVFIKFLGEEKPEGISTSLQILKGNFNFSSIKTRYQLDEKSHIQFVED